MKSSNVTRTAVPLVAGTAGFLLGYEYLGVNCSYLMVPPGCSNAQGWLFPFAGDYRPTWFAAALIAVAAWWLARMGMDGRTRSGVRAALVATAVVVAGLSLAGMWWWPGWLALALAVWLSVLIGPLLLGAVLRRLASRGPWKDVAARALVATVGFGFLATEGVLWGTHTVWGVVRTPHLWVPVPFVVPALALAGWFLRWGRRAGDAPGAAPDGPALPEVDPVAVASSSV
jgi:hypothetical protein